jgi:hypothetical protein
MKFKKIIFYFNTNEFKNKYNFFLPLANHKLFDAKVFVLSFEKNFLKIKETK